MNTPGADRGRSLARSRMHVSLSRIRFQVLRGVRGVCKASTCPHVFRSEEKQHPEKPSGGQGPALDAGLDV